MIAPSWWYGLGDLVVVVVVVVVAVGGMTARSTALRHFLRSCRSLLLARVKCRYNKASRIDNAQPTALSGCWCFCCGCTDGVGEM